MLKNFLLFSVSFSLASLILVISIFRLAQVNYVFSQVPTPSPVSNSKIVSIDYLMPYPGSIKPDNFFWPLKALRDKTWLTVTINPLKKADLELLIADKRVQDAKTLFENNKADLGMSVLTKGEKYLELAQKDERKAKGQGMDTKDFLKKYIMATLKHREILDSLLNIAPEDAKPLIVKAQDYSKKLYNEARDSLNEAGAPVPQNPFNQN